MNRIDRLFSQLKSQGRKALIAYVTGGTPLARHGSGGAGPCEGRGDLVEIGVPFWHPIADGPTIQFSSQKALEGGITPARGYWIGSKGFEKHTKRRLSL